MLAAEKRETLVVLKRDVIDRVPFYWAVNRKGVFGLIPCDEVRLANSFVCFFFAAARAVGLCGDERDSLHRY